jgi:hypothetical protein
MLKFTNYPPEKAGDVELGGSGTHYDLELISQGMHGHFPGEPRYGFQLLGIMASHGISEPRLDSDAIDAKPEDTLEIAKPLVDQVGKVSDRNRAIWFARGILHGLCVDFPDFRDIEDQRNNELFQTLISGISEEAAEAMRRREDARTSSPINS